MNISQAARLLDVNVQTLRYYERRGLIPDPPRTDAGYRRYDLTVIDRVRFIKHAQGLGCTLEIVQRLLTLRDQAARCEDVAPLMANTLARLDAQINGLQEMRDRLVSLSQTCKDNDCRLLNTPEAP